MRGWLWLAACLVATPAGATEILARLGAERVEPGAGVALEVRVRDADGPVQEPQLGLPDGLLLLGTSRATSFEWVNGRSSTEVVFRFQIEAQDPGRHVIGPIRVQVGAQTFMSDALTLVVTEPRPGGGSGGTGPASLSVLLEPTTPWAGQLCRLTVRLVQRTEVAENSDYDAPTMPGFWTEKWSEPARYEAREGNRRVTVVESSIRLYPLAAGDGRIGRARATVMPIPSGLDPLFGRVPVGVNGVRLSSQEIPVHVRALPRGAPAGFDGAVGEFEIAWVSDRSHTASDQPVTVALDVRGRGNIPLMKAPVLDGPGFEVFASSSEDSLPPAGQLGVGRKRFQWTVLPRGGDRFEIPPPEFAWFDPVAGAYRRAVATPLDIRVERSALADGDDRRGFPVVFARHAPAPARHGSRPWLLALAGLALGAAWSAWRRHLLAPPDAPERARQREWVRAVTRATGPDFWRAADEAVAWAEARGSRVLRLREEIAAARFGGSSMPEQDVRRRVLERLVEALPEAPEARQGSWLGIALLLASAALVALVLGLGSLPDARWRVRAAKADSEARAGRLDAAAAEWRALWRESRHPDFAARLAWRELDAGRVGQAAGWVVAGDARTARNRALGWVAARVREAGGLTGARGRMLPLTALECGLLAFAAMAAAGTAWRRRRQAAALAAVGLLAVLVTPLQALRLAHPPPRVVRSETAFDDASITLDPGQVVEWLGVREGRARVRASAGVEGVVPVDSLLVPGDLR